MALDLDGFVTPENKFEGLTQLANTEERNRATDARIAQQRIGREAASSKFITDYLDPKDHLTGTAYDPQITGGYQSILQSAQQMIAKGASTPDVMMAIGPMVSKLNVYATTAKQVNDNIKASVNKVAGPNKYAGYDADKLTQEALKQAFYGPDGKLKDPSTIDPTEDYVSLAAKNNPAAVTTAKGLDDFVAKTPMADYSRNVTTTYQGRSKSVNYSAQHPFYMDLKKDPNGNILTDAQGNPVGLGVTGSPILGDDGKPMMNPETNQPYHAMDKNNFRAVMAHNPDIADYIRGEVQTHFKNAGAKEIPMEGSPQWDAMARSVLGEELATRDKTHFKVNDQAKENAMAVKIDVGRDPSALDALAKYESAVKLKGDYSIYDPKSGKAVKTNAAQTVGEVFNNNPAFLQGPSKDLPDGRTVVDVTDAFPGGGLKAGRGEDYNYKNIYYDPNKRSLILEVEDKRKLPNGTRPVTQEEVPESKAGVFMSRIAAANGIDPNKVNDIQQQVGYRGGKFGAASTPTASNRIQEEHVARVDDALKTEDYSKLKGTPVKDGVIAKVDGDRWTFLGARDPYSVDVKTPDGKTKTVTFKTKDELTNYIKGGGSAPAPTKGNSGIQWK